MLTKRKSRIVTTVLAVAILATMAVGYVSATETETRATASAPYYFYLDLPEYGVTDLATPRMKELNRSYANYEDLTIENETGFKCYLNVRDSGGGKVAGYPKELRQGTYDIDSVKVSYATAAGYGQVGEQYRPSGQTDGDSPYTAKIKGWWTP